MRKFALCLRSIRVLCLLLCFGFVVWETVDYRSVFHWTNSVMYFTLCCYLLIVNWIVTDNWN